MADVDKLSLDEVVEKIEHELMPDDFHGVVDGYMFLAVSHGIPIVQMHLTRGHLMSLIATVCSDDEDVYDAILHGCIRSKIRKDKKMKGS
jgi:hypothetical protein